MLVKVKKIYYEGGKDYVDIRHYIVLKCLLNNEGIVVETPEGTMELTPEELSNPIILSRTTMPSQFGGRYCLFSYPLKKSEEEKLKQACQEAML